jgi:hypothetical protein
MVLKPMKGKIKNNNIATIIKESGIILKYNSIENQDTQNT